RPAPQYRDKRLHHHVGALVTIESSDEQNAVSITTFRRPPLRCGNCLDRVGYHRGVGQRQAVVLAHSIENILARCRDACGRRDRGAFEPYPALETRVIGYSDGGAI